MRNKKLGDFHVSVCQSKKKTRIATKHVQMIKIRNQLEKLFDAIHASIPDGNRKILNKIAIYARTVHLGGPGLMKVSCDDVADDVERQVLPPLAHPRHSAEKGNDAFPERAGPREMVARRPVAMDVIQDIRSQIQI